MTIVAAYRYNDSAIFVNDFRVTKKGVQIDAYMKFKKFNNKLGVFFAGDVFLCRRTAAMIRTISSQVTVDNILEEDGPFITRLRSFFERNPYGLNPENDHIMEGIGFVLDEDRKQNRVFSFYGVPGRGMEKSEVIHDQCVVIGSGNKIPNVSTLLKDSVCVLMDNHNLSDSVQVFHDRLLEVIIKSGPSTFEKLGISPVLVKSILKQGNFKMIGEEIQGEFYSETQASNKHHFKFGRRERRIVLVDLLNGHEIDIKNIARRNDMQGTDIFDPRQLMQRFDPTFCCHTNNHVYIADQWVTDDMVWRVFYKVELVPYKQTVLSNPDWIKLYSQYEDRLTREELQRYHNCGMICIQISPDKATLFEVGIEKHAHNHKWLKEHITNYNQLYS